MRSILLAFALFMSTQVFASDARTYILMPEDTDITELRYAYSEVTTPGLLKDTKVTNQTQSIKHAHYFGIGDNLAAIYVTLPYVNLEQEAMKTTRTKGMGDPTLLFAWGMYNTPALSRSEFSNRDRNGVTAACSIAVTLPIGEYDSSKTFNVGNNRYSEKAECQIGWTKDQLMLEVIAGGTHFEKNDSYFGNNVVNQDNLYHVETHTSYNFTPRLWASFDTFYINGGTVNLNGKYLNNKQDSLSLGMVVGYRVSPNQLVKLIYQNTVSASDTSSKLEGVALSYNYLW